MKSDSNLNEIRAAGALIHDLFTPIPWRFWGELICTGILAWVLAVVVFLGIGDTWGTALAVVVAALAWHRAGVMVHELTHQQRDAIPGVHLAWNLLIGIALLFPSVMYERVHSHHHRKTTYGTDDDPEYLQLAGRPWLTAGYLASAVVLFPLLSLRFLILAPLSWIIPPLRRLLLRHGSTYAINPWFARTTTEAERRAFFFWEFVILAVWWPLLGLTIAGELPWKWLLLWYAIHTSASLVNRLRMMTAHRFRSEGHATDLAGQVHDSIDSPQGWWAELWAPLGLRYHALHHLFPTLPFHALGPAYRRLTATLPDDSVYRQSTGQGWLLNAWKLLGR